MNQQHRALKKLSVEIIASRTLGRVCACNMGVEEGDLCEISKYLEMLLSSQERSAMLQAGNPPVIGIDPASGPDGTMQVRYVAPPGYVMVPAALLSELRDWAHPEIEKYCEMWEGRRDSEFLVLRKVIADTDALLAAVPQEEPDGK